MADNEPGDSGKNKVFVAGLPWETNQHELYELVKPFGSIVEAKIILDRATGKSKGFGFIEMSKEDEARAVIAALNGSELGGRKIYATEFKAPNEPGKAVARPAPPRPVAPRPLPGPPGGVERRSGQDRRKNPGFGGPAPERREFKKPWEKKPWGKPRAGFGGPPREGGGFKKPWGKPESSGSGGPPREGGEFKKPWEKKPWDKEKRGSFGDKKPWAKRPWDKDKKPGGFGDKKPWSKKPYDKKPFGKKPFGKKPFDRKSGSFRKPSPPEG